MEDIITYSQELRLLYVEDNQEARSATLPILEIFFNKIVVAFDGKDGLEKFNSLSFDLIITDINMPKLNGLEMISEIRKSDKDISILVLSAYIESDFFLESIKLGVDGYLLKPIEKNQFLDMLKKITSKLKLQKEAKDNLQFLKQYEDITNSSSIVSKTDTKGIITFANDDFCTLSEYSREELIGSNHNIIRHPKNPKSLYKNIWDTIKKNKSTWKGMLRNITKSGTSYYVQTTIKPILNIDGEIVEYIALRNDVTDIMNPVKQLEDLMNSVSKPVATMIQIEQFEEIVKLYGLNIAHDIENKFTTILMNLRPKKCEFEKVYPIGNGKYVFAKDSNETTLNIDEMITNLKKFQQNIHEVKIDVANFEYDIRVIISLSYDGKILENLNLGIEKLMQTKEDFIVSNDLSTKENEIAKKNMNTIRMVKIALENSKIVSYFQPIVDNHTKKIVKYESLVRLIDEDNKVISPFFFLDISKRGRYYYQITYKVLENSFKMLKDIDEEISINLSTLDIERPRTREYLFKLLEEYKQHSSRVVFELLEDESVKNFQTIVTFINDVKKYGVKIAIDDFGAGYSNFERLLDYQPDILKIDGCLIKNILNDKYSLSIVETIVSFAKKQNIQTIAEFVEDKETYELLKNLDVDFTQGYYFGKPDLINLKSIKSVF